MRKESAYTNAPSTSGVDPNPKRDVKFHFGAPSSAEMAHSLFSPPTLLAQRRSVGSNLRQRVPQYNTGSPSRSRSKVPDPYAGPSPFSASSGGNLQASLASYCASIVLVADAPTDLFVLESEGKRRA